MEACAAPNVPWRCLLEVRATIDAPPDADFNTARERYDLHVRVRADED
jgi:hypothetical protein